MPTTVFTTNTLGASAFTGSVDTIVAQSLLGFFVIRRKTVVADGLGGFSETWAEVGDTRGKLVEPVLAREGMAGEAIKPMSQWRARMLLSADVRAEDQVAPAGWWRLHLGGATSGNFRLTFDGQTTANIAYNATAATIKIELEALSTIAAGEVAVSGSAGGPWIVRLTGAIARVQASAVKPMTVAGISLLRGAAAAELEIVRHHWYEVAGTDENLSNAIYLGVRLVRVGQ